MSKKNVLMVGPDRTVHGGISGVVNMYYEAGLDREINLKYIATMKEGSKLYKLLVAICAYISFFFSISKYENIHIHVASDRSFERKSFFVKLAFKRNKKIILHQHGGDFINWYESLSPKRQAKVRDVLDMADTMLVLAPNWKDYFGQLTDSFKIIVFPNAVPVPELTDKDYANENILFLGRICEAKGINELIAASKVIADKYPQAKILLGGIWEDKNFEKIIKMNCPNIKYLGWLGRTEKEDALKNASIFVMPSHFEGQCISIVEAMVMGCTIVASNTGGIPMMIRNLKNGILVEPKSAESLTEGLITVLEDVELRKCLGSVAREVAANQYNINTAINKLLQLYTSE